MKPAAFDELMTSVRQAGQIRRGTLKPARATAVQPVDVRAVRNELGASQHEFALLVGVSVATLRNWEQGRRTPDDPALALLRVAAAESKRRRGGASRNGQARRGTTTPRLLRLLMDVGLQQRRANHNDG